MPKIKKITERRLKEMFLNDEREYLTSNIFYLVCSIQETFMSKIEADICFCFDPVSSEEYDIDKAIAIFISNVLQSENVDMSIRISKDVRNPIRIDISLELLINL